MPVPVFLSLETQQVYFAITRAVFCVSIFFHIILLVFLIKFTPLNQVAWRKYMLCIQMVLIEWDTVEKQQKLLDLMQKDGVGIPNNLVLENTILLSVEKRYPVSRMRFFSTKAEVDTSPLYVFVVEDNNRETCTIFARPPTRKHDKPLLAKALSELLEKFDHHLKKHGEIRIRSDTITREVLREMDSLDLSYLATTAVFYVTDRQMEIVGMITPPVIDGFHEDSADVEKDAVRIHENWQNKESMETTKNYIRYLPSSVIRDSSTGEAVTWNITSPFGQAVNQFTLPEYRGIGLARLNELHQALQIEREGLRTFKYVQIENSTVLAAARRNPMITLWKRDMNNDGNEIGTTEERDYFPLRHTIIKKKNYNNHL